MGRMSNLRPGVEIPVPDEVPSRERVLHGGGVPRSPREAVLDALNRDRHGRGSAELPPEKKVPVTLQEEQGEPLGGEEPLVEGDAAAPPAAGEADAGEEPASPPAVREIDWRQRSLEFERQLQERDQRHQADMLAMQDHFTRQLEALSSAVAQRGPGAPPQPPVDPDVSPGAFFTPQLQEVRGQLAALNSRMEQRDHEARRTRVSDSVRSIVSEHPVLKGKKAIGNVVAERVVEELFDPSQGVRFGQVEAEARRRIDRIAQELGPDLGPASTATRATQVKRTMSAARTAPPTGRGAETPAPGVRSAKPKNWNDPEERRRYSMGVLETLARGQSAE